MSNLYSFVTKIRTDIPARTASFAGHHGPVAWLGLNSMGRAPEAAGCRAIKRSFLKTVQAGGCDFYFNVQWHKEGSPAIECAPATSSLLPVLDCGVLDNDVPVIPPPVVDEDSRIEPKTGELKVGGVLSPHDAACQRDSDYYRAVTACVSSLCEKGYIPLTISDSHNTTLAAMEGIKAVGHNDVVCVHLSADSRMGTENAFLKRALERKLIQGVSQLGQRTMTPAGREIRKQYEVRFADAHALYDRGVFTMKDMRNQFPVYLSVDLNVLDPPFAPGVGGNPESGGFTLRELVHTISVMRGPSIIGMDIVGYEPENDVYRKSGGDGITTFAAAKLAKEMVLKALTMSGKTRKEIDDYVKREKLQGNAPAGNYL